MTRIEEIQADINIDRLAEICEAECEGRLHIAPIADGTTIWYFAEDEDNITNIYESTYLYGVCEYHIGELGENVFLTQEEAEKAFAEREGNNERY